MRTGLLFYLLPFMYFGKLCLHEKLVDVVPIKVANVEHVQQFTSFFIVLAAFIYLSIVLKFYVHSSDKETSKKIFNKCYSRCHSTKFLINRTAGTLGNRKRSTVLSNCACNNAIECVHILIMSNSWCTL